MHINRLRCGIKTWTWWSDWSVSTVHFTRWTEKGECRYPDRLAGHHFQLFYANAVPNLWAANKVTFKFIFCSLINAILLIQFFNEIYIKRFLQTWKNYRPNIIERYFLDLIILQNENEKETRMSKSFKSLSQKIMQNSNFCPQARLADVNNFWWAGRSLHQ